MVPGHALRIQSMLRSMQEVVIPAIPRDQNLAHDQANIIVGNLRLMSEQHDKVYQYELVELREYTALVRALIEASAGGVSTRAALETARQTLEECAPVAALVIPTQSELSQLTRAMKLAADMLLRAAYEDGDTESRRTAIELVMRQSATQVLRERRWFRMTGFELEPEKLPTLEQVLA